MAAAATAAAAAAAALDAKLRRLTRWPADDSGWAAIETAGRRAMARGATVLTQAFEATAQRSTNSALKLMVLVCVADPLLGRS